MRLLRPLLFSATIAAVALTASARIDIHKVLPKLTLEQKARLLVGTPGSDKAPSHITPGAAGWTYDIPELGIPSVNLADGPVGPRINPMPWIQTRVVYDEHGLPHDVTVADSKAGSNMRSQWCTAFPSTTALAATFDAEAARLQGEIMGDECAAYGVDILLNPGVNIMRNPLCGRNFEYYSEDPLLTGVMAAEVVKGTQSKGIGTSLKHFVANNQQTGKKYNDARMSQRALREIYLPAFERVVRTAQPWTIMGSYNYISGRPTQTNRELMQTLLRDEWGYKGLMLTDWTVWRPAKDLIAARCGLIMPGNENVVQEIISGVNDGLIPMEQLDSCVADVLRLVDRSLTAKGWQFRQPDLKSHAAVSRRLGAEAMVLLKNNNSTLPIKGGARIALFGTSAYQSIAGGTGSSNVNKPYVVDIDSGLINAGYLVDKETAALYRQYNATQALLTDKHPGCPSWQKISYHRPVIDEMPLKNAETYLDKQAAKNEAAVVVIGRKSGETSDRVVENDFNLSEAEKGLIDRVCTAFHAKGKPVVVVLNVCGSINTASWRDKPDAIVMAWFPGQECGNAVADVLGGRVNPSGRLPMTLPLHYADIPSAANYPYVGQTEGRNHDYTNYAEDIWVGYRYFDKTDREVAYPFGYGLSYTTFDYSKPQITRKGNRTTVSVTITNTGSMPGREVVQLYVSAPERKLSKPLAELRAFGKTRELQPGESQRMSLTVSDNELASFNDKTSQWETDAGYYAARLGRSAGDYIVSLPFFIKKPLVRPVNDILAPIVPVKTITPAPSPYKDMTWHAGTDFPILGRVYPDSLPVYSRIPAFLKKETREELYNLGQHTAGMAIRFCSNSPKFALRWENKYGNDMTHMSSLGSRGADLYYRADDGKWHFLGPGRPMGNPTTWMMVENMEPAMREYMLHLPLYDSLNSLEIGIAYGSTIEAPVTDSPRSTMKPVVVYGSSIQHGATASRPGMAATNMLRRELDVDVINLGFSANAHIDYEIALMMADVDASVYVLDFMPNAWVSEIEEKTENFVKILRDRHPDVPLIFMEDPYWSFCQFDKRYRQEVDNKNAALRKTYDKMVAKGMKNTYFLTQAQIVPQDYEGFSDGIHYTDTAFRYYSDTLIPIIKPLLKQK